MRFASLTAAAAIAIALPFAADAVTRQSGIFPDGSPADMPGFYISDVEFNIGDSGMLARTSTKTGDSRRTSAAYSIEFASVPVPLPVSVLMLLAAFGGLAFLSHRRTSALT